MNSGKMAMFLLGASLALGFAFSARTLSSALVRMRQSEIISVKGTSQTQITSDLASWKGRFTARDPNLSGAYKILEKCRARVAAQVEAANLADDTQVKFLAVDIETMYELDENGRRTNRVEKYVLSQTVAVSSREPAKVDALSKSASQLIADDIEFTSFPPSYTYSGIEKVKLDLLAGATRNGYERASTMASNAGGKLGSLVSASQGVFQITTVDSTDVSSYGEYDTSTIDKLVKAVITLEFSLAK